MSKINILIYARVQKCNYFKEREERAREVLPWFGLEVQYLTSYCDNRPRTVP